MLTLQKWGLAYPRDRMVLSAQLLVTVGEASQHALLEACVRAQQLGKRSFACAHARHLQHRVVTQAVADPCHGMRMTLSGAGRRTAAEALFQYSFALACDHIATSERTAIRCP